MTPRGERAKSFLRGLLKFVGLVAVAGAIGAALGIALLQLSGDGDPAALQAGSDTASGATVSTATAVALPPPPPATPATTKPSAPPNPPAAVRVSVIDARLFTDETPSGAQAERARMTVRIQAENIGEQRVTLQPPTLRVGKVRIPADPAGGRFDPLAPTGSQTVTLRFELAGEATPKVVRDRRARILIAGHSVAMRVKIRPPTS